jgi:transcriptional regulator with XRE-family HTH domain
MTSFGEQLRELRQHAGLTQLQIAERTGVSNTYISALESGRKQAPPRVIVTALASCLGTTEESLWTLARAEREERLKQRIDGIPTSQRTLRAANPMREQPAPARSEDVLEQAIQTLKEGAQDPKQRHTIARTLEALANSLRGKA